MFQFVDKSEIEEDRVVCSRLCHFRSVGGSSIGCLGRSDRSWLYNDAHYLTVGLKLTCSQLNLSHRYN